MCIGPTTVEMCLAVCPSFFLSLEMRATREQPVALSPYCAFRAFVQNSSIEEIFPGGNSTLNFWVPDLVCVRW